MPRMPAHLIRQIRRLRSSVHVRRVHLRPVNLHLLHALTVSLNLRHSSTSYLNSLTVFKLKWFSFLGSDVLRKLFILLFVVFYGIQCRECLSRVIQLCSSFATMKIY